MEAGGSKSTVYDNCFNCGLDKEYLTTQITYKNTASNLQRYNKANYKTVIMDSLGSILTQNNTTIES